jgi:hypothetical protein
MHESDSSRVVQPNSETRIIEYTLLANHPTKYDWLPLTFLNLVIQTGFIPNTKMLSTLLITKAGLGKTSKLDVLRQYDFIKYTLDITPKHLADFLDDVQDNKVKFLVLPDYIATLGHAKKTIELARTIFRGMIEEGISAVDIFGMERKFKFPIKAGLISGITPEYYNENTRVWKSDGFLSRFLPFSYSHSNESKMKIMDNIRDKIDTIQNYKMKLRTKDVIEPIRTKEIDNEIKLMAYGMLQPNDPPYRTYIQLIALCNASAVLRDSEQIEKPDIDLVTLLSNYINRTMTPI